MTEHYSVPELSRMLAYCSKITHTHQVPKWHLLEMDRRALIGTKLTQSKKKKAQPKSAKPLFLKVELTGIEPVTS